jgi:DHA2 family multidrug resistance protein
MGSFLAMGIVGRMLEWVDAKKLLAGGVLVGAFTLFEFGALNLEAGYWDIFWPQFLQGIGLGLLFVPLTTITMNHVPREKMGNATSIFNLMRNIGGSLGIAGSTTLLARRGQLHVHDLGAHVDPYSLGARNMLESLKAFFVSRGADLATATAQAEAAVAGLVRRQATMVAFSDVFRLLALLFIVMLPLILLMRSPSTRRRPQGAAH